MEVNVQFYLYLALTERQDNLKVCLRDRQFRKARQLTTCQRSIALTPAKIWPTSLAMPTESL